MTAGLLTAGAPVSTPPPPSPQAPQALASGPLQTHAALGAFALLLPPAGTCFVRRHPLADLTPHRLRGDLPRSLTCHVLLRQTALIRPTDVSGTFSVRLHPVP